MVAYTRMVVVQLPGHSETVAIAKISVLIFIVVESWFTFHKDRQTWRNYESYLVYYGTLKHDCPILAGQRADEL